MTKCACVGTRLNRSVQQRRLLAPICARTTPLTPRTAPTHAEAKASPPSTEVLYNLPTFLSVRR